MGIMGGEIYRYRRLEKNHGRQCSKLTNGRHLLFIADLHLSPSLRWMCSKAYTEVPLFIVSKKLE